MNAPASFNVMLNYLRGLALDVDLVDRHGNRAESRCSNSKGRNNSNRR